MPTTGKTYFIINKKANTAFDLSGKDQKSIIGFGFHGGDNQKVCYIEIPRFLFAILDLISIPVEDRPAR